MKSEKYAKQALLDSSGISKSRTTYGPGLSCVMMSLGPWPLARAKGEVQLATCHALRSKRGGVGSILGRALALPL